MAYNKALQVIVVGRVFCLFRAGFFLLFAFSSVPMLPLLFIFSLRLEIFGGLRVYLERAFLLFLSFNRLRLSVLSVSTH